MISPDSAQQRMDILRLVVTAIRSIRLYPPSSTALTSSIEKAVSALNQWLSNEPDWSLSESDKKLLLLNRLLTEKEQQFPYVLFITQLMIQLKIKQISIEHGLSREEFISFITVLNSIPEDVDPAKWFEDRLKEWHMSHIHILNIVHHPSETRDENQIPLLWKDHLPAPDSGEEKTFVPKRDTQVSPEPEEIESEDPLGELLRDLTSPEKNKREEAARSLSSFGPEATERLLDMLLEAPDRVLRVRIVNILTETGPSLTPLLLERIEAGAPWYYIRNLLVILGKIGNEIHLKFLKPLLNHPDTRVKREALSSIFRIGGNKRLEFLTSALNGSDESLKIKIVEMIGMLKDPGGAPPLIAIMESRPFVQSRARINLEKEVCHALGQIGSSEAIPLLNEIANPKGLKKVAAYTADVKAAAREALERIVNKEPESERKGIMSKTDTPSTGAEAISIEQLSVLITEHLKEKRFNDAEILYEKFAEKYPLAVSELFKLNELIESGKTAAMDQNHLKLWTDLYALLSREEANTLYYGLEERPAAEDEFLFRQGESPRLLFFINHGHVTLFHRKGKEELQVTRLGPGDIIGAESFFYPTISTISARANTPCRLNVLTKESMKKWKTRAPALEKKLENYCLKKSDIFDILKNKKIERRIHARIGMEGKILIQLYDSADKIIGKSFRGELSDLSENGASFLVRLSSKENARLLLGKKLQIQFINLETDGGDALAFSGIIVAVRYHSFTDFSIHTKLFQSVDLGKIRELGYKEQKILS